MNPNWIRMVVASILFAVALKIGLPVVFWAIFTLIFGIFVLNVVKTNIGSDGFKNALGLAKMTGKAGVVIAIFLVLLLLGSIVEEHLSPDRPKKLSLAWNAIAFLAAGGIAVAWISGKKGRGVAGMILAFSMLILTLRLGFPSYASTWPKREQVSTNLVDHGVVGTSYEGVKALLFGKKASPPTDTNAPPTTKDAMPAETTEALVLAYEGVTPCSTIIDYRAKIRWGERRPLRIKFPGVDEEIEFPGEGAFKAPPDVCTGETFFVSPDPNNLHFTVQVYKKITVRK